jgi:protein-tyrosine phosphatase
MDSRLDSTRIPYRVLVICKGNVCRSAFAAASLQNAAFRHSLPNLQIRSAGTDGDIDGKGAHPAAVLVAKELGIDLSGHVAHQVTVEDIDWSDVVLVMDHLNSDHLNQMFPERMRNKDVRLFGRELHGVMEIPDPHQKPIAAFRECLSTIAAASDRFMMKLARTERNHLL